LKLLTDVLMAIYIRLQTARMLPILVMCKPGLAQMPGLGPGLRGLGLSQSIGRAEASVGGWAEARPGSGHGFGDVGKEMPPSNRRVMSRNEFACVFEKGEGDVRIVDARTAAHRSSA
jgi:hypothetical protein